MTVTFAGQGVTAAEGLASDGTNLFMTFSASELLTSDWIGLVSPFTGEITSPVNYSGMNLSPQNDFDSIAWDAANGRFLINDSSTPAGVGTGAPITLTLIEATYAPVSASTLGAYSTDGNNGQDDTHVNDIAFGDGELYGISHTQPNYFFKIDPDVPEISQTHIIAREAFYLALSKAPSQFSTPTASPGM